MQGTTTNGKLLLPFKTGAFLAGVPVQPCVIKYKNNRVSPSWDSINALWHVFLVLANPIHSVTVYMVRSFSVDSLSFLFRANTELLGTGAKVSSYRRAD